jgi:phosphate transport system substrate-binding protein
MKRVLLSLCLLFCFNCFAAHAEEIIVSTGSGPLDSVINPVKDAFEKETGIKINIQFGSASLAFKQCYRGASEVAAVGTSISEILEILKKEGFEVSNPESFRHIVVGRGIIHTIVNKENPVSKLSKEQLKGIFTGTITNWKQVGGNDVPIIVVLSTLNPATTTTFKKIIMDSEPFTKDVLELGHMDELLGAVEANAEAIVFGTSAVVSNSIKRLETPEVFRPVTLVTKGEPSTKVKKFIDFILTGPGKKLVKD